MKILAITFDTELSGGANRSFIMVITSLIKNYKHSINVIIPGHGEIENELKKRRINYDIVSLPLTGVVLKKEKKDFLRKMKANIRASYHYMKAHLIYRKYVGFDLVYINGTSQLFGYYLAKKLRKRYVWHFRGYLTENHYYCFTQKKIFNDPSGNIIVISNSMYHKLPYLLGINQSLMRVIHNGIDGEISNRQDILLQNDVHCVLAGRLISIKGQMDAINALKILKEKGITNIYLHLAGDLETGNQQYVKQLKKTIAQYDLKDRIFFEGQVSDMNIFRKKMDIELICSVDEPFGRVTVEGMRSGLLVIGSNSGGTLDIVQNGYNGFLYVQGCAKDLANKINYVINNRAIAQNIACNAFNFSKTHFTEAENVKQINNVFETMVTEPDIHQ